MRLLGFFNKIEKLPQKTKIQERQKKNGTTTKHPQMVASKQTRCSKRKKGTSRSYGPTQGASKFKRR